MKPVYLTLFLGLSLLCPPAQAQHTRYGGDPFLLGAGARSLGLGSAFVAISDDATAVFWNPAGLVHITGREIQIQHAEQFGGTINHDVFTLAGPSRWGGFGLGLLRLGVDDIRLTELEDPTRPLGPDNRPVLSQTVGTTDYNLYLSYGRRLKQGLSLGASLKLIWRNLSAGSGSGFGLDLGVHYQPRPAWTFGMVVRNLTRTKITFDSGATDRIPPSVLLGVSAIKPLPSFKGKLTFSFSAHLGEEKSGLEDAEGLHGGVEYLYQNRLAFRLGSEGDHLTAGTGLRLYNRFALDLAFLENGHLDNTYRISVSLYF